MNRQAGNAIKIKMWLGLSALALALFLTATPASADSVTLSGVGGANQGGVYVAPYFLSINGGASVVAMCDDYAHSVSIGQNWDARTSAYSDLSLTRWGSAKTQQYKETAWLFSQYFARPSEAGDINFAAWALFTPGAASASGFTSGASNWLAMAGTQSFAGFDFSGYRIITPKDLSDSGPQEYITKVPEPANLALVAVGLMVLALMARGSRFAATSLEQASGKPI
jgi:hypothetical protein